MNKEAQYESTTETPLTKRIALIDVEASEIDRSSHTGLMVATTAHVEQTWGRCVPILRSAATVRRHLQ